MNFNLAIMEAIQAKLDNIHTAIPGKIIKYDGEKNIAEVKPLIKKVFIEGEILAFPNIVNVPVIFPISKNAGVCFPVEEGDGCLILFCEMELENWLNSSLGEDVEPSVPRTFSLSDAFCIPGLIPSKSFDLNNEKVLQIFYKNSKIIIGEDKIKIENGGGFIEITDDGKVNMNDNLTVEA